MKTVPTMRLLADVTMMLLAWLPTPIYNWLVEPHRRGFFCDDESIRYPYVTEEAVSNEALFALILIPPMIMVLIVEAYRVFFDKKWKQRSVPYENPTHECCGWPIPPYLIYVYIYLGIFLLGLAFVMAFTQLGKYTIGRLRPHFITVCKPDWTTIDCGPYRKRYVIDFNCTGDPDQIRAARVSFPSGHSSTACYSMVYVVVYLEARGYNLGTRLVRPVIQLLFLALAVYTALSRVADYWHHPTDVLSGSLLGSVIGSIVGLRIMHLFRPNFALFGTPSIPEEPRPPITYDANGYESTTRRRATNKPKNDASIDDKDDVRVTVY